MKKAIHDDRQVRRLAKKLGAWPAIAESIAKGHSGSLIASNGLWVFGYFLDGLVALQADNPLEQAELALMMASRLPGPVTPGLAVPSCPTEH